MKNKIITRLKRLPGLKIFRSIMLFFWIGLMVSYFIPAFYEIFIGKTSEVTIYKLGLGFWIFLYIIQWLRAEKLTDSNKELVIRLVDRDKELIIANQTLKKLTLVLTKIEPDVLARVGIIIEKKDPAAVN